MTMRLVHALAAMVFVVAIVVQVFLAGAALLQLGGTATSQRTGSSGTRRSDSPRSR